MEIDLQFSFCVQSNAMFVSFPEFTSQRKHVYNAQANNTFNLRFECATHQNHLQVYFVLRSKNLNAALVVYIQQLSEDATHAKLDWRELLNRPESVRQEQQDPSF